jgi:hypothetical protein
MKLTPAQVETYYQVRLDPYRIRHSKGMEFRARCPFHGGDNPSALLVHLDEGHFRCFACGAKGGSIFAFEMEMQRLELGHVPETSAVNQAIERVLGTPIVERYYPEPVREVKGGWDRSKARARYMYTDEQGNEVLSVWRFVNRDGSKATPPDQPCKCSPDSECENGCQDGRFWGSRGARRVLYRLPDVMQSVLVFVVEGEKNVDDLSRAIAGYIRKNGAFEFGGLHLDRVAVTTNMGGATGWKKEYGYGPYFFGKTVIKLGDNDGPGRKHDADVCADVCRFAREVYTLELPVGEGEDISDFLDRNPVSEFFKLLANRVKHETKQRKTVEVSSDLTPRPLLVKPSELNGGRSAGKDWLIPGLIEKGRRGLIVAAPKTGKSLMFLDVAVCLATGRSFLGLRPYSREVRVAIVSREDGPQMVRERLEQLARGHGIPTSYLDRNILVNTEEQSSSFQIDNPKHVEELAEWLRVNRIEFCVIDVLNKIHSAQENSSDDMTRVMKQFDELARESGAQICVIHHTSRSGGVKGSTSIEGWADYIFHLEQAPGDPDGKILSLRTKSGSAVDPLLIRYIQSPDQTTSEIRFIGKAERRTA